MITEVISPNETKTNGDLMELWIIHYLMLPFAKWRS
jgi:hypothetical protein